MDRNKVIKTLQGIRIALDMDGHHNDAQAVADAIALIEAQREELRKSVKPVKSKLSWEHGYNWDIWDCGHCGSQLRGDANYCDRCGHKVNWDDMEGNNA